MTQPTINVDDFKAFESRLTMRLPKAIATFLRT